MAAAGFIAIAPDLFWRMEPGVQLTDKTEEEWARAFDFFNRFDVDRGVEDLRATEHTIRGHAACNGNVGCIGYCLGGKLAYLMATRSHVDVSVGYYGVGLDALLNEAENIKKPLLLHIAEDDKFVSPEQQEAIKSGLADNGLVTIYSYPGVNHAFSRIGGEHYDADASHLAKERTMAFLQSNLKRAAAA